MIQNLTITANSSSALVSWITQEGPMLKIDLTYIFFYVFFIKKNKNF